MDPNLEKIKELNMHAITRGSVQKAINQAEDYLVQMLGFNNEKIDRELNEFISNVKAIRRKSRGQKRKQKFEQNPQD